MTVHSLVNYHDLQASHYLPNINPFALDVMPCEGVIICDPISVKEQPNSALLYKVPRDVWLASGLQEARYSGLLAYW